MTTPRTDRARRLGRWRGISGLAILLAGLALCAGIVRSSGLWADELFSLAIATGHSLEHPAARADPALGDFVESPGPTPPSAYARYLGHESPAAGPSAVTRAVFLSDTSPPLYYLSLWAWTRAWGAGDGALRLHSVAWWAACLWPLTAIARRVGGRRAILPAQLIFCLSPASLYFATEGRMYSMLWFLTLATAMLTLSLRRDRRSWWRPGAWAAISGAGFLTHYFFAFPWAACLAWSLAFPGRTGRARILGAACLLVAALIPWYVHVPESLASWRVTADWLKWEPANYSLARSYAAIAKGYFFSPAWVGRRALAWAALASIPLVLTIARRVGTRWFAPAPLLLMGWLLASLLGPAVFDLLRGTYTVAVPRYAISGLPAAYLLLALGLARLGPMTRLGLLAAFLVPWFLGVRAIYRDDRAFEPFRQVGAILAEDARETDVVIVHSIPSGVAGVARYMAGPGAAPCGIGFGPWVGQLGRRRVPEDLAKLLDGRERARLVLVHAVGEPAPEEEWLRQNATFLGDRRLGGATILDFAPAHSRRFGEAAPVGQVLGGPGSGPEDAPAVSAKRGKP
jgi:hypothetical protein